MGRSAAGVWEYFKERENKQNNQNGNGEKKRHKVPREYIELNSVYNKEINDLKKAGVEYNVVRTHKTRLSESEIIEHLGGADQTKGSCASVALAYVGQKAGYDVTDYRDGESRSYFALNIQEVVKKAGGNTIDNERIGWYSKPKKTEINKAMDLLGTMEEGKEYYFYAGNHASIVRKKGKKYEYLELQSKAENNGYKQLNTKVLRDRFGARGAKLRVHDMEKFVGECGIVDIEKIKKTQSLRRMLGYINTSTDKQKKGEGGGIK